MQNLLQRTIYLEHCLHFRQSAQLIEQTDILKMKKLDSFSIDDNKPIRMNYPSVQAK
jgi:hypothetical protein